MEYRYSTLMDTSAYETEGLCDGLPVRIHNDYLQEDIAAIRAQEDWSRLVGPIGHYRGGLAAHGSFIGVSIPECIPERLEIVSYANEFAFLHDDQLDKVSQEQGDVENDQMLDALRVGAQTGSIDPRGSGKMQMQSQILHEMIAIDRERALTATKSWAKFVQLAAGRQHNVHFATLEQYIPYRILDIGQMFWFGLVTFGMAITIPEDEMGLSSQLLRPGWIALGLSNDFFSWEKEREAATRMGATKVVNAIYILMEEHAISVSEAKEMCRALVKENVAEYIRVLNGSRNNMELSLDLRRYLEAFQYALSGNVVWSVTCPRYHPEACFSELQSSMMQNGLDKTLQSIVKDEKESS